MFTFSRPADPQQYASRFATISYQRNGQTVVEDFDTFLQTTQTTAFIVIKDDVILYEKYFNGYDHASTQTSFSVAKSFVSALVGIAIQEGYIKSVDDPITDYIPELTAKDQRFTAITIRHLLTMSSGIRYVERGLPWSDDSTTYFAPDLRALALSAQIEGEPGRTFHYNNFHPLLLGLILERATGQSVSQYLEAKIWRPLGMEAPGSWSLDSQWSGFEKLESGLNGRALDFARFGQLYLHEGNWNGKQLIPRTWVKESTRADTTSDPALFYQYCWWVSTNLGQPGHFSARGNHGQYIYVVPEQSLVMVRFGKAFGYGRGDAWPRIFEEIAAKAAAAYKRKNRPSQW
jgi:CubicO group peptidase (beta-lactamase class C family)